MTLYTRSQPVATDDLDISQVFLANNTNAADSVFGFEHYAFSNQTANQGLHNSVTTPPYIDFPATTPSANPPMTTTEPILYGYTPGGATPSTQLPVIQWSRGVTNSVPTPLTTIQSPLGGVTIGAGASIPVFNFSGMNIAYANVYAMSTAGSFPATNTVAGTVFFNGTTFTGIFGGGFLKFTFSGSQLNLTNSGVNPFSNNVYWTIEFLRIQ